MDGQLNWVNSEFLNVFRDYILYLQQIGFLLISAVSVIIFKHLQEKTPQFWVLICFSFFFGLVSLIIGLFTYSNVLGLILDASRKVPDLTSIKLYIYIQFISEFLTLILLILSITPLRRSKNE
jgi:hypothetical protein